MSQTASPQPVTGARVCAIISFVLSAIAILFLPIVFGLAAIALAIVAYATGDKVLGKWAIPVSVMATVLGFVLGYLAVS